MNNTKAVDEGTKYYEGDRVKVRGCGADGDTTAHWGTVIRDSLPGEAVYAEMDDGSLRDAFQYTGARNEGSYMAVQHEIEQHIPQDKVVMHGGRPVNIEDHGTSSKPLTAHDDIQATLVYLNATTKRKWKAVTKDICLEVDGTTAYAGSMTISFQEDK